MNLNFLEERFSSSLSIDSYSLGKLVLYPWQISIANPLFRAFASAGMPPANAVEEPEQDSTPSSGPSRSGLEDVPNSYYISPSFHDKLKNIIGFEVKFSFKRNYKVVIPLPIDTVDNPLGL